MPALQNNVTHEDLIRRSPHVRALLPEGWADFSPAIREGFEQLQDLLRGRGLDPGQIAVDGDTQLALDAVTAQLSVQHVYETASRATDDYYAQQARRHGLRARQRLEQMSLGPDGSGKGQVPYTEARR